MDVLKGKNKLFPGKYSKLKHISKPGWEHTCNFPNPTVRISKQVSDQHKSYFYPHKAYWERGLTVIEIPPFVTELHCSQSGPRLCYQHPCRHFWLKKYQFPEPWQFSHKTRGLWKTERGERQGINHTWMKWTMKQIEYKLFLRSPRLRRERWRDEENTPCDNMIQWMTAINHTLQRMKKQQGKQTECKNENSRRAQRNKRTHTQTDVSPHSWAQNCFCFFLISFLIRMNPLMEVWASMHEVLNGLKPALSNAQLC